MNNEIRNLLLRTERVIEITEIVINEMNRMKNLINQEIEIEERKQLTRIDNEKIELIINTENKVTKLN